MNLILHTGQGMGKTFLDLLQTGERVFYVKFPRPSPNFVSRGFICSLTHVVEEFCLSDRRANKQG